MTLLFYLFGGLFAIPNIYLYARVIRCLHSRLASSDAQVKEGDSIPAQRDALRKYAKKHGYIIAGEYIDDGISGTKYSQRDELQRMLTDVEEGKIDLILFVKLDRFRQKWPKGPQ